MGWGRGPTSLSHLLLRLVLTSQKGFVGFLYKKNKVVLLLTPKHHRITNVNRLCFYFGPLKMINTFFPHLPRKAVQAPNGMCFDKIEMSYKLFMTDKYQQVDWV